MSWVVFNHEPVVLNCILSLVELMQNLTQAEVSWDRHWIELDTVSEVLLSLEEISTVGQLRRKMNTSSEVALVKQQALLEVIDALFKLLDPFILASNMEVSDQIHLLLIRILRTDRKTLLEQLNGFFMLVLLLADPTKSNKYIG